jgi:hypothetical protein
VRAFNIERNFVMEGRVRKFQEQSDHKFYLSIYTFEKHFSNHLLFKAL